MTLNAPLRKLLGLQGAAVLWSVPGEDLQSQVLVKLLLLGLQALQRLQSDEGLGAGAEGPAGR